MLENIQIENFRGIKNLFLNDFSKINFFIGKANTGKTSVLEAIYLSVAERPEDIMEILEMRNVIGDDDIFKGFFYDYGLSLKPTMKINGKCNEETKKESFEMTLELSCDQNLSRLNVSTEDFRQNINLSGNSELNLSYNYGNDEEKTITIKRNFLNRREIEFQNSIRSNKNEIMDGSPHSTADFIYWNSFSHNLRENLKIILPNKEKKEKLREICQKFSKDMEEIYFVGNKIVVQQKNLENAINFKLLGEGFQRYIDMNSSILTGKKYIFIDEIENGLHFGSIEILIKSILDTDDMQFFITTHNQEFLEKMSDILNDLNEEKVSVFNVFKNKKDEVKAVRFSQKQLCFNIENENELRD